MPFELASHSPEETHRLGRLIGQRAQAGDTILLSGVLGAGKTCLVQGIAQGLGISEVIPSPSFVLVRQFAGRLPLYHIDLYRLDKAEIDELGLDDYLYGRGVCAVEWAQKGLGFMPADHLLIELRYIGENERRIVLTPCGSRYEELVSTIGKGFKMGEERRVPGH